MNKIKILLAATFIFASAASNATSYKYWINSQLAMYSSLPAVIGVTVSSSENSRTLAGTAISTAFRSAPGEQGQMNTGDTFKVRWPDGSAESFLIVNATSSTGSVPIPGSQLPAGSVPAGVHGVGCPPGDCLSTGPVSVPSTEGGNESLGDHWVCNRINSNDEYECAFTGG